MIPFLEGGFFFERRLSKIGERERECIGSKKSRVLERRGEKRKEMSKENKG